jgi:TetR/AcrR family transcriptional repressor of lmrAB and yxaGH operons
VSTTIRLLQRAGLHGTALQDVLAESGAPRGSLYFHFPGGKEELVREALREAAAGADRRLRQALAEGDSAAAACEAFLAAHGRRLEQSGFTEGCPVAGVGLDVGGGTDRLRAACDWALTGWVTLLAERLRVEGRSAEEAEALALTAIAALEGALLLCRARRSLDPLLAVSSQLRRLLGPEPAPVGQG